MARETHSSSALHIAYVLICSNVICSNIIWSNVIYSNVIYSNVIYSNVIWSNVILSNIICSNVQMEINYFTVSVKMIHLICIWWW